MSTLVVSRHKIINVDTLSRLRVGLVLSGCKGRVQTRLKICVGWLSPVWTRLCRPWSQLTPFTIDFWARQHNICRHGRSMKPTGATTKSIFYFRKRKRVLVFWFMVFVTYALVNNAVANIKLFRVRRRRGWFCPVCSFTRRLRWFSCRGSQICSSCA